MELEAKDRERVWTNANEIKRAANLQRTWQKERKWKRTCASSHSILIALKILFSQLVLMS